MLIAAMMEPSIGLSIFIGYVGDWQLFHMSEVWKPWDPNHALILEPKLLAE